MSARPGRHDEDHRLRRHDTDWGFTFQLTLAVIGAALFFGGNVAYRNSARTGVRSSAAAGIATGVVMLGIVLVKFPAFTTSDVSPAPIVQRVGSASPSAPIDAPAVGPGR